ncbi:MAG: BON domain-containing protein [Burkholderiales bacterium]
MKLNRTARAILGVTALAWSIPFAQAETPSDKAQVGVIQPQASEAAITAEQLHERAEAARYAEDTWLTTKVKTALLREKGLDSMDVSVETDHQRVLLSGFVANEAQKRKALLVASAVGGVKNVKDGLEIR